MTTAIKIENLAKKYIIRHQAREQYSLLRDAMANSAKNIAQNISRKIKGQPRKLSSTEEEFWALRDISFSVDVGDRIGIIGRNGAGKSTLLKVLSRITEPTSGKISILGRVASLLEVGTGFHMELTGRENIYLNGAILGMTKAEIKRKFDDIVEFAGVTKFLDTPVKRYSSGMNVRLGFAVAAHLDPEILLVDEVLAVGDLEFQKKCLGKMREVSDQGRTIFFVSHNLAAVSDLCRRGVLLDNGRIAKIGGIDEVVAEYRNTVLGGPVTLEKRLQEPGPLYIKSIKMVDENGRQKETSRSGEDIKIQFEYEQKSDKPGVIDLHYVIVDSDQIRLFCCSSKHAGYEISIKPGKGVVTLDIPKAPLQSGVYQQSFTCFFDGKRSDKCTNFDKLLIAGDQYFPSKEKLPKKILGAMLVDHRWECESSN